MTNFSFLEIWLRKKQPVLQQQKKYSVACQMHETRIQQTSHSLSLKLILKFSIISLAFKTLWECCSSFISKPEVVLLACNPIINLALWLFSHHLSTAMGCEPCTEFLKAQCVADGRRKRNTVTSRLNSVWALALPRTQITDTSWFREVSSSLLWNLVWTEGPFRTSPTIQTRSLLLTLSLPYPYPIL